MDLNSNITSKKILSLFLILIKPFIEPFYSKGNLVDMLPENGL